MLKFSHTASKNYDCLFMIMNVLLPSWYSLNTLSPNISAVRRAVLWE